MWKLILVGAVVVLGSGCASCSMTKRPPMTAGSTGNPKHYVCRRATSAVVIDGRMNEAAWGNAPWTDLFVDIEGGAKPKPRFTTRAKMLWDDRYFYIAVNLEEPHVWGTLEQRDQIVFHDNDFEVLDRKSVV